MTLQRSGVVLTALFAASCGGSSQKTVQAPAPVPVLESDKLSIYGFCAEGDYDLTTDGGKIAIDLRDVTARRTFDGQSAVGVAFLTGREELALLLDGKVVEDQFFQLCALRATDGQKDIGMKVHCAQVSEPENNDNSATFFTGVQPLTALVRHGMAFEDKESRKFKGLRIPENMLCVVFPDNGTEPAPMLQSVPRPVAPSMPRGITVSAPRR